MLIIPPTSPPTQKEEIEERAHRIKNLVDFNDPKDAWALSIVLGDLLAMHKEWGLDRMVHRTIDKRAKSA